MPNFQFDPTTHSYTLDGMRVPSVTQCLPYNYHGDNREAMERGMYIHEMCRLYLMDDLNEATLDPVLMPYLDAFKRFWGDTRHIGIHGIIDIKSGSPHPCVELQIAAYIELANRGVPMHSACDYQRSDMILEEPFYHSAYGYAGTPDIIISGGHRIKEGYALYLKKDGNYVIQQVHDLRRNLNIFLSFLTAYKWEKAKGLL